MALATIVAGRYAVTFTHPAGGGAQDLGVTNSPGGYKVNFTPAVRLINGTDAYSENAIEGVYRGWADVGVSFVTKEWTLGQLRAVNPFSLYITSGVATSGAGKWDSGLVGRRVSDIGGTLIMTATAGTPAAASPATATFTLCTVREGFNMAWLLDSIERDTPFDFRVYGLTDSGSPAMPRYFTVT